MVTRVRESSGQLVLAWAGRLEVGEGIAHERVAVFPIFERELRAYSGGHISEPRRPPRPPQQPSEASLTLDRVSYRQSATVVRNPG